MLDVMRSWKIGIKVILGLVVLSFIIFYAGNFAGLDRKDKSIYMATVGKEHIDFTEFQNTYKMVKQQQEQYAQGAGSSPEMDQFFRQQTIQGLVDRKLMLLEARRAGMKTSDDEVQSAILKYPFFQRNGAFVGMDEYSRIVDAVFHMNTDQFEESVGEDILLQKYNDMLTAGLLVTDKEVEEQFRKNLTAKIDYVLFSMAPLDPEAQPKPEEIRAYYDSHQNEFQTGEQRKVQYLLISHASEKNKVQVPEAKLKEYYEANKSQYSRPEQVKARHILLSLKDKDETAVKAQADDLVKQLRAGADFTAFAKQYSEDPGSKDNGGDLGFFERGRMVGEFEKVAFSLPVNEISDPVKTSFGYHIIQVTAKQPAYEIDFNLIKNQLMRQLAQPQEIKNAQDQAKHVYDEITKNKKNMADISKLQLVDMKTTDYISRTQPAPGMAPAFIQKIFELKNKNDVSEPIQVFQDYAVAQLIDIKPSEQLPFEKVQGQAAQKLSQQRATELTRQKAEAFYNSVTAAAGDLKAAAEKEKLTVKTSEPFAKDGFVSELGQAKDLSDKVFAMKSGEVGGPLKTDQGLVVFKVAEKKDFSQADFEKDKDSVRNQILSQKQSGFLQSYRSMLRKKYEKEIWINTEAINPKEA